MGYGEDDLDPDDRGILADIRAGIERQVEVARSPSRSYDDSYPVKVGTSVPDAVIGVIRREYNTWQVEYDRSDGYLTLVADQSTGASEAPAAGGDEPQRGIARWFSYGRD